MNRMNAQVFIITEHKGANVKGSTLGRGYPILLKAYKGIQYLHKVVFGYLRQAKALGRVVHTLYILGRAEKLHLAVLSAVSL